MFHHHVFYPQQQQQQPSANHRVFPPNQPFFYRSNGLIPNHSTHNLNFTHDFERFPGSNHGFTTMPSGGYSFFDQQQRWRPNVARRQQVHHRRTPAFHFQDKSTSYFMTDPIKTSDDRIAIQLTKVHIGPNGDQQRVFVEQEFSNEKELKKFVRNLRENFEKTFNNRSSGEYTHTDDSSSTDSKKSGVVVVEEPDEEPKVYEQQAYNANIESKQAAASVLTPPSSPPTMHSATQSPVSIRTEQTQKKQTTPPPISHISSTSTARSNHHRRQRNKTKYRRQKDEQKASHIFQMPSFSRQYPGTPVPPRFQQRFFHPNQNFHPSPPHQQHQNFQWRFNQNTYPKTRSRSYVPPMADHHIPRPPPTPAHFQNLTDPFFRPIPPTRFAPQPAPPPPRHKNFHAPSPSSNKFPRPNRRRGGPPQPATITENHVYPNNIHQQPRVQRTKSECRNLHDNNQRQKSRSTTNQFQQFSPLQPPPTIQRHFVPFRSAPVFLTSMHTTAPIFYPNQRRQYPHAQTQFRLVNQFHLGTNRF